MTAIPFTATPTSAAPRAKTIFYVRSVVALAMIATWGVSALSGIALWLAADGRAADLLPALLGVTKHAWNDIHVVASVLAVVLTLVHVTVMRRGVLSYARLILTGKRSAVSRSARRPRAIVYVRAVVVVAMAILVPLILGSGVVHWLAADGRRAGQQLLLFALTKHDWADIHTAIAMGVILIAATHVVVVRAGLVSDIRLLATGQRSVPGRVRR
ncbi:MAG: DUF4405 domain-containing protein [Chloroflexota bacterium]|nr:DUF4405 domain-containing protein [Chloroflexota bacterium]